MNALNQLLNNPAFWVFLGTLVTAFFGYKQAVKLTPAGKVKASVKSISSFEELRSVVEVLQSELVKKDKRHREDTDYILEQLREARLEVTSVSHKLAEAAKQNVKCNDEINRLKERLDLKESA